MSYPLISLSHKIVLAQEVIKKAYEENNGKLFISFSGGKDSTVLMDIALKMYPDLKVVFSNTTNELIEILQYVKKFPNVETVTPEMSFKGVVRKHGFPLISKETSQKVNELKTTSGKKTRLLRYYGNNKGNSKLSVKWRFLAEQQFDVTHKCCKILKKDPLGKWAKKHGLKPIIALMKDESRLRSQLSLYGEDDGKKVYPFLKTGWTEDDIWKYAKINNIRFAECYYDRVVDGVFIPKRDRTGCEYCMFGIDQESEDRFLRSKILTPKRYVSMMKLKNNGVTFEKAREIALSQDNREYLGISGGNVGIDKDAFNSYHDIYTFKVNTMTKECPYCKSRKVQKDISIKQHFYDIPHPDTKQKRSIFVDNHYIKCSDCKGTFLNDLHMFNLRFGVTKRLIDYIYSNMSKKSIQDISAEVGLGIDEVYDIAEHCRTEISDGLKNKHQSIWFTKDNELTEIA